MKLKLLGKGTALRTVAATLLVASITAAVAEESEPRYTVSAISDAAQGGKVLANKELDTAIAKLEKSTPHGIRGFYVATNLCVAYLKKGKYEDAQDTCDRAVAAISKEIGSGADMRPSSYKARVYRRFLSVALSNRGVAYALNGAPELAREDFHAALEIRSDAAEPQTNLARLAQATATPAA